LPPALSAKDLPGEQTPILNVCQIRRNNNHPVKSDEDSATGSISDTEYLFNWDQDLDNPNHSEDNHVAVVESDTLPANAFEDWECPEQRDLSAAANIRGLIRPPQMSR